MMRKVRKYKKEQREEILLGQKSSAMPVGVYCRKQGIPLSTFYTWRKTYQKPIKAKGQGFIRVTAAEGIKAFDPIKIRTSSGYQLKIPAGTDECWIQGIIDAVKKR